MEGQMNMPVYRAGQKSSGYLMPELFYDKKAANKISRIQKSSQKIRSR
jgi:hypothetical protein